MATVEKPQPMDVDPKKVEEKPEEKTELVNIFFVESLSNQMQVAAKLERSEGFQAAQMWFSLTHS
jgi:hypothetical protein